MREEYRLFVGEDQQFYFNLEAGNNKVILRSSEGYTTKAAALNGIESVRENSQIPDHFQRFIAENDEPQFRLVAGNGKIIGVGESYSSEQMMEKGIRSVMKNGPVAPLNDTSDDEDEGDDNQEREFNIIVNGRPKVHDRRGISFEKVVELAFGKSGNDGRTVYTVTYSKGPRKNPKGTLAQGEVVRVKNGMIFNVTPTDKS